MSAVQVEDVGSVRVLRLNRPERRNALDLSDRIDLLNELERAQKEARCLVLTGRPPVFCAGGDIRSMSADRATSRRRLEVVNAIATTMVTGARPIVAAVEGGAFGLGLSLACAADIVVAGDSARFAASFARIGLAADTGLSYTLPERVGRARARQLLLTARQVHADEALRLGLVDELVDRGDALERALETAQELAALSAPMLRGMRRILQQADQGLPALLDAELEIQMDLLAGADFAEGQAAFVEHRAPHFASD